MNDRTESLSPSPIATQQPTAVALDPIRVAWRWKWLIALGTAIGAGLGYLEWTKTPTVYVASARIQVTMPLPVAIDELELDTVAKLSASRSRADDEMIIKSANVLKLAVADAGLSTYPEYSGWDEMSIVRSIQGGLRVEPASKDLQTTVVNISYTSGNPKLSEAVVGGVISGYNSFLSADHKKIGNEIIGLVNKVREELDTRYQRITTEYTAFRNEAPLYWIGGEGKDPFAQNLSLILSELGTIELQITLMQGRINTVEQALKQGRPLEGVLLMLMEDNGVYAFSRTNNPMTISESFQARAEKIRDSQLLDLRIREKGLLESGLGENHPSVQALKREIRSYEELAAKLEDTAKVKAANDPEPKPEEPFDNDSIRQRINAVINGLKETVVSLQNQKAELEKFREENETKSRELQSYVNKNQMYLDQLKSTQGVIASITSMLDNMSVVPESSSRTMQELDRFAAYPSRASMNRFLMTWSAGGALICCALGYLLSFADRRYKGPEDVIRELGRPIWGQIPLMDMESIDTEDSKVDRSVVVYHRSKSNTSESFRGVRTSLYFGNRSGDLKLIQVTSASPADGKSTLAANLAVSVAQSGRSVALVDCDFRRPRIDKIFGLDNKIGLSTLIAGKAEPTDIMYPSEIPNLTLIPSGSRPSNPAELLSSQAFAQSLQMLREKFDYVIIDSPPILAVSDPANIAAKVDGTLLALRLRHNDRSLSTRALKMLSSINANVIGVVVIGVTGNGSSYGRGYGYGSPGYYGAGYTYGYGYGYGYGDGAYGKNPYMSYYDIPDADDKRANSISKN